MYYPYLRGRQYELIALRELLERGRISDKIVPIVEPVKLTTGLLKTISLFAEKNHPIAVIVNPTVGFFDRDIADPTNRTLSERWERLLYDEISITKTVCLTRDSKGDTKDYINQLATKYGQLGFICDDRDKIDIIPDCINDNQLGYCLIPPNRHFLNKVSRSRIVLEDCFIKRERNKDYKSKEDEFFSDYHITYKTDYSGFSDYSIIGKDYIDGGFAPYAVAIHVVYLDESSFLRVHHFVSDSDADWDDVPGKYGEAAAKLDQWLPDHKGSITDSLEELASYYTRGLYPALGPVKKLSIMHHMELMNQILSR